MFDNPLRKVLFGAVCGALALGLVSAGGAQAAEKVVAGFPTNPTLSIAPQLMAIGMGYYEEAGLEVEIAPFQGSATLLPQITQQHVDFGWINPDVLIVARQPGRDPLPVRAFYNGIPLSPYEIIVLDDSPLQSLDDLKGKKIGVGALSWGNLAVTKTQLRDHDMELGTDYEFVPVGVGATAFRALTSGQVDALNLFDTLHTQLELTGTDIRRLPQAEKYLTLFSSGWIAHNDTLNDKPDLVVAFTRATTKGIVACNANPEACVENFWSLYPNMKPVEGTEEEKLANAIAILKVRLGTMIPHGDPSQMGHYTDAAWKAYVAVLHNGGQVQTEDIPVGELYTNEFTQAINDFDVEAVTAAAKAK